MARFDAYRASLEDLVANVGSLYSAISALPPRRDRRHRRPAARLRPAPQPAGFDLVRQVTEQFGVDAVLDTGDITDWGSSPENRLIGSVGTLGVPYVYIRGNHDSGATAALIAAQPGRRPGRLGPRRWPA